MASVDVSMTGLVESRSGSQVTFTYVEKSYHETAQTRIMGFRRSEDYTDVLVKSHHVEISCHKLILAAGSKYLHTLLNSGNKKPSPDKIELNEVSPEILADIIDFFYTAKIQVTSNNVKAICLACPVLQLDNLRGACDKFMAENIAPYNCFSLFKFSKANDLEKTLKAAQECMLTKPKDILRLALELEYQSMGEEDLISYISNDDLQVDDEAIAFEIVLKWVESDRANREKTFANILQYVRLPFCTPEFLCNVKEVCPYSKSEKCEALIWEAMKYHVMPASRHTIQNERTKPRKCIKMEMSTKNAAGKDSSVQVSPVTVSKADGDAQIEESIHIVVMGGNLRNEGVNRTCWFLDEDSKTWVEFTKFPTDYANYFQAVCVENQVIVTGGDSGETSKSNRTSDCWLFDISSKKWKALPHLQIKRCAHTMVYLRGDLYVCGGLEEERLDSCEKLDSSRQKWCKIASLLEPSFQQAGVAFRGGMYVFGGIGSPKLTQHYCPTTNMWQKKADIPKVSDLRPSAVVLHDKIYVVGGSNDVCLSYDPEQDSWTTLSKTHDQHKYGVSTLWKGRIVLGGGWQAISIQNTDAMEEYSPVTDMWTKWKIKLPKQLAGHSMLVIPKISI